MKKINLLVLVAILSISILTACQGNSSPTTESLASEDSLSLYDHSLMIYCGAGMTKPFEEITTAFKEETGCDLAVTYANAGQIQSQINTAQAGDLFIAGSSDELAPVKEVVTQSKDLVKHIPVLVTQKDNPKSISGIKDLANAEIRTVLGDADSTPIGKIANKALTDTGILNQVNVIARTTTAPAIATALETDEADAGIIWKENAGKLSIVDTTDLDTYIKTVPAATLSYCQDQEALMAFLDYLDSDEVKSIWTNYGYETIN